MRSRSQISTVLALAALAPAAILAGCGEGSSKSPSSSSAASGSTASSSAAGGAPGTAATKASKASSSHAKATGSSGAATDVAATSTGAVAYVASTPISKSRYEHWLAVERHSGVSNASHQALAFLITSQWVLSEAAQRDVSVSEAQVKGRFGQLTKQAFSKGSSLQSFMAKSGQTEADLLGRVKVELLQQQIASQVTAGKSASQRGAALASFEHTFHEHWKPLTRCEPGYVMEDCSAYKGGAEDLTATSSPQRTTSSGSSSKSTHASTGSHPSSSSSENTVDASNATGEVYPSPKSISLTSSAFERNGALPAQYTCAGSNISPPLEWSNLPAKTEALVLFIIDLTSTGPNSGIRWVVGDINPNTKGVAAGATPEGGIVGSDTQGHAGYGGICPPAGKTATIEFVMYALSKKIDLSPGFQPDIAEAEYGGSHKLLLGEAGITYAIASH